MGFVKQISSKITGADIEQDVNQRNAAAQAANTRAQADATAKATKEATIQAARVQESAAARASAQSAAADQLSKPLENADVALTPSTGESAVSQSRKRRQSFGIGSANTGVNI